MPSGNRSALLSFVFSSFSYHCHVGALSTSFSSKQNTGMEKRKNILPPNWDCCSDAEHQESKNQPEQQPQTALTSTATIPADIRIAGFDILYIYPYLSLHRNTILKYQKYSPSALLLPFQDSQNFLPTVPIFSQLFPPLFAQSIWDPD